MAQIRDVMTPQQVADYLQISVETVYRYIRDGKLIASRLGRHYRVQKEDVDLLLRATATFHGVPLREFTRERIDEWIAEDRIDAKTRRIAEDLLDALGGHGTECLG